jgi:hypothetical protein
VPNRLERLLVRYIPAGGFTTVNLTGGLQLLDAS